MIRRLLFLAVVTVATTASASPGQEIVPGRALVSTTGSAEIRVVPDLADVIFQVEVRSTELSKARKEQAERVTKVLAALRSAGITEAELQTSPVEIVPHYEARDGEHSLESATVQFYSVSQYVSCTLRDIKKIPSVTADAVAAGVTATQGAILRTSQLRKYRDEARAKAIRAAKEKAVALAGELGGRVGHPYAIKEDPVDDRPFWPAYAYQGNSQLNEGSAPRTAGDNAEPTFAVGRISVSAAVSVSFLLD
jgi:uncharacterized protein